MKRFLAIVGLGVAVCAIGLWAWRSGAGEPRSQPTPAPLPVPVVAAKVEVSDFPIAISGIGTVIAFNTVDIHAQVTGTIEQVGFVEGQTVHPGSLIAQLDPRPFQAALQQAQANLARDQAQLKNAQVNLNRYDPLLKHGYVTDQQVIDQAATVSELQAAVEADKAALFNAQTQLGYTTITSPIDGVTGIRRVDIGNIVQPSTATPIVTIAQIQPISVVFTLPQKDIHAVQAAMAKGSLKAVAYGQGDRKKLGEGTLLLVNNVINRNSGTVQLKATFPNQNRALWPGAFVNIRLIVDVRKGGISAPLSAVEQGQSGAFVFVVLPDRTVRQRAVVLAETLDGRALIASGLHAGDEVVLAGQYRLSDGVKIVAVPAGDPHVQSSTEASAGML